MGVGPSFERGNFPKGYFSLNTNNFLVDENSFFLGLIGFIGGATTVIQYFAVLLAFKYVIFFLQIFYKIFADEQTTIIIFRTYLYDFENSRFSCNHYTNKIFTY